CARREAGIYGFDSW
nr:immunoglobulin heavy chain junction region [Macaca mulatta]